MGRFLGWKLRKHFKRPISSDNFSQYIPFRLHIFLYIEAKIFDSSNIFKKISIFEGLRRFFKIQRNLRLWSFFWTQRFFVFVFGPFSIFFATLFLNCYKTKQNYGYNTFKWNDGQFQKFAIVQRRPISYFIDIYKLNFNQKGNGFPTEL